MATKPRHRFRHEHIPREARTTLVWDERAVHRGDKENGEFYKCWNCGFICHDKVHALGGSKSGDAITHLDFSTPSIGIVPGVAGSAISVLGDVQKSVASLALNSSGGTKTVLHSHRTTGGGCPLCHSLNWRGDFP